MGGGWQVNVTLLAATIAFVGAIAVALVNAIAARFHSRAVARRTYRASVLQGALEHIDRISGGHESLLGSIGPHPFPEDACAAVNAPFPAMAALSLIIRTTSLQEPWKEFKNANEACHGALGAIDREKEARRSLAEPRVAYEQQVAKLRKAAGDFHRAVETFIY